ncbi:MAG: VOC family protein [Bacteroidia bacterium]
MATINPYLTFDGNCEQAFDFYKSVFGGEFTYIGRFNEMPDSPEFSVPEADKNKIMHVSLPIGGDSNLFGSDTSAAFGANHIPGTNISLSINALTVEEATRLFMGLSAGGNVTMPLNKTFWGAFFGMFTDKFGIHWQVNCELSEHKDYEDKNGK